MTENRNEGGSQFFGSFPTRGVWTALGLSRGQFVLIIGVSVLLFVLIDGPLWKHVDANHFRRITVSYISIPVMIAAFQLLGGGLDWGRLLGGSIVIGVIKLLVTALIVLVLSF